MTFIDRYLDLKFFLIVNMVIILLTETVGGGTLFFTTGIIHIIAISFVVLALVRVFFHYYTYDPILEKFIHACLAAMAVFAISHLVEFASFAILHQYKDAVYVNVANFYLISLLLITIGAEHFLRIMEGRSSQLTKLFILSIIGLTILSAALLLNDELISLEPGSIAPFVYTGAIVLVLGICLKKIQQIKKVGFMPGFVRHLSISVILIGAAIFPSIYYEFLVDLFHIPEYQAVYLSHFFFYAALSFLFLTFSKVARLGGMLDEVRKMNDK